MKHLTLRQLRSIQTIDDTGKISDAARKLGLTAPAVTLQLQQVEDAAGMLLFDRTSEGVKITAAGRAFVEAAGAVDEILSQLEDNIDSIKGVRVGRLRLAIVSTAKYFAPFLIAGFAKIHPEIEVEFEIGNRSRMVELLRKHEADLFIMGRPPKEFSVRASVFGDHPLVMVAPPDHPLARARDISKERIAQETLLIREPGSGTRTSLEIFMSDIPGKLDNLGVAMDSNETIKQAAMAGLGVGFVSAHTLANEVASGKLVILDVESLPVRRQWFSVTRTDRAISPVMASFQEFLLKNGAQYFPEFPALYSVNSLGIQK